MSSVRTTVVGVLVGMVIIVTQVINVLDNDPATIFSLSQVFAGLGTMGIGYFARDNKVSSETAGAK